MSSDFSKSRNKNSGIIISGLSKRYGTAESYAVKGLSLTVNPGEVYGFLGPNGAGKSTTIRLLMNFIQPTTGTATVLDKDIVSDSVFIKRNVGYLSGDFAVYPKMTGEHYLQYLSDLHGSVSSTFTKELAKRLKADLRKPMGDLSRGNRQKIGIIQALMHRPKVLILDEPTSGLDPLMQEVFYGLLNETKQQGTAVFMSSHILGEVQKVCDRVGIIRAGKLVDEATISDLATAAAQTFDIQFAQEVPIAALKNVNGLEVVETRGNSVTVHMRGKLSGLFAVLAKYEVRSIDARNLDLEDLFIHFYKDEGNKS